MLNSGDPVDISVWKSDGSILELRNCISLRYNFYGGWRNVKLLTSGECRRVRDCCIFRVNDCEVFYSIPIPFCKLLVTLHHNPITN